MLAVPSNASLTHRDSRERDLRRRTSYPELSPNEVRVSACRLPAMAEPRKCLPLACESQRGPGGEPGTPRTLPILPAHARGTPRASSSPSRSFGHCPKTGLQAGKRPSYGQGPSVSPCARCAGTACWSTKSVTDGFVADSVRWQISTLCPYWYCAAAACGPAKTPAATAAPSTASNAADASRPLSRRRWGLDVAWSAGSAACSTGNARTRAASSGSTSTSSGLIGSNPSSLSPSLMLYPLGLTPFADCNDSRGFPHKAFAVVANIFERSLRLTSLAASRTPSASAVPSPRVRLRQPPVELETPAGTWSVGGVAP
jgi:hypothetical protein